MKPFTEVSDRRDPIVADYLRRLKRDPNYPVTAPGLRHQIQMNELEIEKIRRERDYMRCVENPQRSGRNVPPEPKPQSCVTLGVDCSEPLMVSLPDDVLTECE